MANKFYIDIKKDSSLENRYYEAVKLLATQTGSLNKRLFDCYWEYLFAIRSSHFKEQDIKNKLKYIETIMYDKNKCTYYKFFSGGRLHCHWKESKQMAANIFQIYNYIIETRYENDR